MKINTNMFKYSLLMLPQIVMNYYGDNAKIAFNSYSYCLNMKNFAQDKML